MPTDNIISYGYGPTSSLNPKSSPKVKHQIVSPYTSPRLDPLSINDDSPIRRPTDPTDPDPISASTYDRFMDEFVNHSLRLSASSSAIDGPLTTKPNFIVSPFEQIPDQSARSRNKTRSSRKSNDFLIPAGTPLTSQRHRRSSSGSKNGSPKLKTVETATRSNDSSNTPTNPAFFIRTFRSKTPEYHNNLIDKLLDENPSYQSNLNPSHSHSHRNDERPVVFLDSGPNGPSHGVFAAKQVIDEMPMQNSMPEPIHPLPHHIPNSRSRSRSNPINWKSLVNLFKPPASSRQRATVLPNGQILKSSLKQPPLPIQSDEISFTVIAEYILDLISRIPPLLFIVDFINSLSTSEYYYLRTFSIYVAFLGILWFGYYLFSLIQAIFVIIRIICSPVIVLMDLIFGSHTVR